MTALAGAAGAVIGLTGSRRRRNDLKQDAELLQILKDTAARAALEQVVTHQATILRDRVVHGIRLNRNQRRMATASFTVALGVTLGIAAATRPDFAYAGPLNVLYTVYEWSSLALLSSGALSIGLTIAPMAMDWIAEHSDNPNDLGPVARSILRPLRHAIRKMQRGHPSNRAAITPASPRESRHDRRRPSGNHRPATGEASRTVPHPRRDPRISGKRRPPGQTGRPERLTSDTGTRSAPARRGL